MGITEDARQRYLAAMEPHLQPGEEVRQLAMCITPPRGQSEDLDTALRTPDIGFGTPTPGRPTLVAATDRRVLVLAVRYENVSGPEADAQYRKGAGAKIGKVFGNKMVLDLVQEQEIESAQVKMGRAAPGFPAKFEVGRVRLQSPALQKKDGRALVEEVQKRGGGSSAPSVE